jgi:hypothetical protein
MLCKGEKYYYNCFINKHITRIITNVIFQRDIVKKSFTVMLRSYINRA